MSYQVIFLMLIKISFQSTRIRTKESYTINHEIEEDTIRMAHIEISIKYQLQKINSICTQVDILQIIKVCLMHMMLMYLMNQNLMNQSRLPFFLWILKTLNCYTQFEYENINQFRYQFLRKIQIDIISYIYIFVSLSNVEVKNQCVGFPKHPQLKEILQYKIKDATEDSYYTDMVTLSEYSNLFLMTQELQLIQVKLRCSDSGWIAQESQSMFDLKKQLKLPNSTIIANALFSCPKKHLSCLIITPFGGFWVSKFSDFDSNDLPIEPYPEQKILQRKVVHKVSTFGEYLAVAVGDDGVDLYTYYQENQDIYQRNILHLLTISKQQFNVTINIIGVKIIDEKLFCLDDTQGLFIFNISNIRKPVLIMDIHITRTVAFEVYENTVLVVAQTPSNIEYILEIFIDLRDRSYFVNRVFVDDFTYRDLQINPNYVFLIGEEAHLIIKHSIFNGFVKYNKELVKTFFENQLVRFELYSKSSEPAERRFKETFYYVGLSRQAIHVWKFMDYHAFLLCSFDERSEHEIIIKLNSTSCDENIKRESLYQQCQAEQKINIQVSGPLFYSDSFTILVFILICLGVLNLINLDYFMHHLYLCMCSLEKITERIRRQQILVKRNEEVWAITRIGIKSNMIFSKIVNFNYAWIIDFSTISWIQQFKIIIKQYLLKQQAKIRVANVIMTEQPLTKEGNLEMSQKLCVNQSVVNLCDITAQLKPAARLLQQIKYLLLIIPQQQLFDQFVKENQFDLQTPIIFFDEHIHFAARAWFTFRYFGFKKVFVLDGGYSKWINHQPTEFQEYNIQDQPKFQGRVINTTEVGRISQLKYTKDPKGDDWAIIDTRDSTRFKKGSIPGSINIEFQEYLNEDKTMKSDEDLKQVYQKNGIDLSQTRIINTCQTGKLACIAAIAQELLKTKQQILYDGSWEDWKLENRKK